jgi:TonB family protein
VVVSVTIRSNGRVADARLLRSIPLLDVAALDAIKQWRFMASAEESTTVTVTVRFVLEDPLHYPRPATYRHDLPSWIPGNFAFVYKYECRAAMEEIDSITRLVTSTKNRWTPGRQFPFDFEREQAAEVFIALVGAGFFDDVREGYRTWKEVPPVEAGIDQTGDQILVTVTAPLPLVEVVSMPQITWFGGDRPVRRYQHGLRVRRVDHWKEFSWYEPLDANRSESDEALAASGRRIRALVKKNLSDAGTRPACL